MLGLDKKCKYMYRKAALIDKWFCEIRNAVESGDEEFFGLIPEKDYQYWFNECKEYPNPDDYGHLPPRYELPERCGFRLRRVV